MNDQMTFFDFTMPMVKIDKPIRLVELFSGYGSQAMALERLGVEFEHHRSVEFDKYAMASYNAVHGTDFEPMDICNVHGRDLGIGDSDYVTIMTYSFPCFTGDTLVLTKDGYKRIRDIKIGDYVLTHKNQFQKVVESRHTGRKNTISIKTSSTVSVVCTENHLFYSCNIVRRNKTIWKDGKDVYVGRKISTLNKGWKRASELMDNDWIMFPVIKDNMPYYSDNCSLWYVLGRYLADGCVRNHEKSIYGKMTISCNEKKMQSLVAEIKNTSLEYRTRRGTSCYEVDVYNRELNELISENIGFGSHKKFISNNVLSLPQKELQAFFDGYISGDGSIHKDGIYFSTVNKQIVLGMQQIIAKLYRCVPSVSLIHENRKKYICGVECNVSDWYECFFNPNAKGHKAFVEADGELWIKYKASEDVGLNDVFDIQVENDHSFTVDNLAVHNCTDLSLAGKRAGMAKGTNTRSALIWEVERILSELCDLETLPEVLLLENVTAIHSQDNMPHFQKWLDFLNSIGYTSYVQDLNAADYGMPQHRDRTFVVSILGEYNYKFPNTMELTTCMEDYFEDLTDEQALKLVCKGQKAMDLMVELDEKNKLE